MKEVFNVDLDKNTEFYLAYLNYHKCYNPSYVGGIINNSDSTLEKKSIDEWLNDEYKEPDKNEL